MNDDEIRDSVWDAMKDEYTCRCMKCGDESIFYKGGAHQFGVTGVYICSRCNYAFPPITEKDALNMRLITEKKYNKIAGNL